MKAYGIVDSKSGEWLRAEAKVLVYYTVGAAKAERAILGNQPTHEVAEIGEDGEPLEVEDEHEDGGDGRTIDGPRTLLSECAHAEGGSGAHERQRKVPELVRRLPDQWQQCALTKSQPGSYTRGECSALGSCAQQLRSAIAQHEAGEDPT